MAMVQAGTDERVSCYLMNETVLKALDELLEYEKSNGKNSLGIITRAAAEIEAEGRR